MTINTFAPIDPVAGVGPASIGRRALQRNLTLPYERS